MQVKVNIEPNPLQLYRLIVAYRSVFYIIFVKSFVYY